jgi:hypothetical protein
MVNDRRNNHETLHHSVIVGGQYNSTSRQFAELRAHDPDALEQLFRNATEASLLPTERQLRWYKTQMSSPITPKQIWDVAADAVPGGAPADEVDDDIDTGLAPQRPRYVPDAVWAALSFSAKAPVYATSFLINRGLVPQDNLKVGLPLQPSDVAHPPFLSLACWSLRSRRPASSSLADTLQCREVVL